MNFACACAVALAAATAACSATSDPAASSSASTDGAGASNGAGGSFFGGAGPGGGTAIGCSADLQSRIDEHGNEVPCPPDQGCADGVCIVACDAAAQSKHTIGCDFLAPTPPFYQNGGGSSYDGACHAVFLANAWGRPAKVTVERGGQSYDASLFARIPQGVAPNLDYAPLPATGIPPHEVAVLFLSHLPGAMSSFATSLECPVTPAILEDSAIAGAGKGSAFRVRVDTPVTAYDILPYGGAVSFLPSASLLFPTSALGAKYYGIAPHPAQGTLWAMVVAAEDATSLTVTPSFGLYGGGPLSDAPAAQSTTFTLGAGEMLQWTGDPTGAAISSDKPVAVYSGNTYLRVDSATNQGCCQDAQHAQIPQLEALGSEYVGAGIVTRLKDLSPESLPYRLLGVVDGTQLEWQPAAPAGAPAMLSAGQVVEFETTATFVVRAQDEQHPFVLSQYMPGAPYGTRAGCATDPPIEGLTDCQLGDEEWLMVLPPRQYLRRYVFFTDPTYATTNVVLSRVRGADGFSDVIIECLGTVSGWKPVGTDGTFEIAHVDLVRAGVAEGSCGVSQHEASSDGDFGIVVWGTDWAASYGYPAGGNVGSINDVPLPVPK